MSKDRRSKDQKRKAKLTQRTKRRPEAEKLAYDGEKYRADKWTEPVFETELAVYEAIVLSDHHLTNKQVEAAFVELIHRLRAGLRPTIQPDEPEASFGPGLEMEFLIQNIRRHWGELFEEFGPVASSDLVGILRTLLFSMEAQAWARGKDRGYVDFLPGFMRSMGVEVQKEQDKGERTDWRKYLPFESPLPPLPPKG